MGSSGTETGRYINLTLNEDETVYISVVLALSVAVATQDLKNSLELTETIRETLKHHGVALHNNLSNRLERVARAAFPNLPVDRHEGARRQHPLEALIDLVIDSLEQDCKTGKHCQCSGDMCCYCGQPKGGSNG